MRCKKHTNWQNKLSNVQDDLLRRQALGQDIAAEAEALRLQTDEYFQSLEACQECDPLLAEAIDLVRKEGRASVSMLQRRMRIGYTRAARIVDMMEDKGIVGPPEGTTQLRQILDYGPTIPPKDDGA